jgi:hypothetical protein
MRLEHDWLFGQDESHMKTASRFLVRCLLLGAVAIVTVSCVARRRAAVVVPATQTVVTESVVVPTTRVVVTQPAPVVVGRRGRVLW